MMLESSLCFVCWGGTRFDPCCCVCPPQKFAALFETRVCESGTVIIRQGDAAEEFFIVSKGLAEVYWSRPAVGATTSGVVDAHSTGISPTDVTVSDHFAMPNLPRASSDMTNIAMAAADGAPTEFVCSKQRGDFFGEAALTAALNEKRSATVLASGSVQLMVLSRTRFEEFVLRHPAKKAAMATVLGQRMDKNIRSLPFLASLPESKIPLIGSMFRYVPLRAGETLFEEGSLGQTMYVIHTGKVKAFARDKVTFQEVLFKELGPGEYFGEISLLVC